MITLIYIFAVVAVLFAGWRAGRRLHYFLHIFQLQGYKINEYRQWIGSRRGALILRFSHKLALFELALVILGIAFWSTEWTLLLALPAWAITFASSRRYRRGRQKKPLKFTHRMKRLTATATALTLVFPVLGFILWMSDGLAAAFYFLTGLFLADLLAPMFVPIAAILMMPVEALIQRGFKQRARRRIEARSDLTVIGITGSYGKTSTKFIIADILRQRYNVLASPSSYNTPMGLCLVINNMLRRDHQVIILEMGIRYPGDMRDLCEIASPDIAVVTSIGVAHLETMGSKEEIAREKSEILRFTDPRGAAVLNFDDPHVRAMADRAPETVWRVSVQAAAKPPNNAAKPPNAPAEPQNTTAEPPNASAKPNTAPAEPNAAAEPSVDAGERADHAARGGRVIVGYDVRYGREGAEFKVRDDTGEERSFRTQLLGEHNIINILLGIAVGRQMGLRLRQMIDPVARIEPIEHRLQLRKEGPITVIDDAFNSNPVGARNAVEILGQFNEGRRVIVTPGMIELGDRQWYENRALGEHIAENVDLAILVGEEQTRPIREGLESRHFPGDKLKVVSSLFDAQSFLKSYLRPGDVVLYENDLPDQFDEG